MSESFKGVLKGYLFRFLNSDWSSETDPFRTTVVLEMFKKQNFGNIRIEAQRACVSSTGDVLLDGFGWGLKGSEGV